MQMTSSRWPEAAVLALTLMAMGATRSEAQINTSLTDHDRAEIQALSVTYLRALLGCAAEEYADLFATPGGYFGSPVRGEVRDRASLMEMVRSYDRCDAPAPTAQAGPPPPAGLIEPAPEGARARIPYSANGGYYDDVYVRTPAGWRFKSRNVISDQEAALGFLAQDAIAIRHLAGDDHGHYENLYGAQNGAVNPRGIGVAGPDTRPFRTSGLRLTIQPDGTVTGLAYLRDNGGHYEDVYMRTPQGWRIKERTHIPAVGAR